MNNFLFQVVALEKNQVNFDVFHEELEEFCLTPKHHIGDAFRYLDRCPKLKIIRLEKIKLNKLMFFQGFSEGLKRSEFKTLQEFRFTLFGPFEIANLKSVLEILSKKPNMRRIVLTMSELNHSPEVREVCHEIESACEVGLKKKVRIRVHQK